MAVTTDSLIVDISVDTKDASKSLQLLVKDLAELKASMKASQGSLESVEKSASSFGVEALKLNAIVELATKAFHLLSEPVMQAVDAFAKEERALGKLSAALSLVGQNTKSHVQTFQDFANELEETANVSKETTFELAALAKAGGLTDDQTKELIETSANLATITDRDVNQAMRELMGQYAGMPGRIAKIVPEVAGLTDAQLRAGKGIDLVSARLKNLAEKDAQSLSGTMKGLRLSFEEFLVAVGETIVKSVNLPAQLQILRKAFDNLREGVYSVQPYVFALAEALVHVDWLKVAQGVGVLGATFLTFKVASSGISLTGLISSVKDLAVAAWAAVAPFLEIAAVVAGVVAVAAAIDILISNLDRWQVMLKALTDSAKLLGNIFVVVVDEITIAILKGMQASLDWFSSLTGIGEGAVKGLGDRINTASAGIDESFKRISGNLDDIKQSSSKLDFGITGEGVKFVRNAMEGVVKSTHDAGAATKDWSDKMRPPIQNMQEIRKIMDELADKNMQLATDIANMGATTTDQIQNTLQLELTRLDIKRKQLEFEGKLTKEIDNQFDVQKALIEAKAARQTQTTENPNAVSPDQLKAIKQAFGQGAADASDAIGQASGALSGVMSGVTAVMGAVNGVLDFVQQLIDFIPQVLSKLTNIFNSLTDLPTTIAKGVKGLMDSVVRFVSDFVPNLLNAIPDILDSLITGLLDRLPEAVEKLMEALPDLILRLFDKLPDLMEKLVQGLITASPRIIIAWISFLIKDGPKIMLAMFKLVMIELPKAIIKGFVEGMKQLANMIKNAFRGIKMPNLIDEKAIANSFKKIGKQLTGATSQLFNVKDLVEGVGKLDEAKKLAQAIEDGFEEGGNILKEIWDWILAQLTAIWNWVWDHVLKPFLDFLQSVWNTVYAMLQTVWQGLMNLLKSTWDAVASLWRGLMDGITSGLTSVGNFFNSIFTAFNSTFGALINAFKGAGDSIVGPLNNFLNSASNIGQMIWGGLKAGLDTLQDFFNNLFSKLDPANLLEKMFSTNIPGFWGKGDVEDKLGIDVPMVKFATGGMVPGTAAVAGDSALNDRILALLSPGEAIIPRSLMDNPMIAALINNLLMGKLKLPQFAFGGVDVGDIGGSVGGAVGGAFQSATDAAQSFANDPVGTLSSLASKGADELKSIWDKINPVDALWQLVWDQVKKAVMAMFEANHFHTGGLVPLYSTGGDVPATLQAGEFVMNRQATNAIGVGNLAAMNAGRSTGMQPNVVFNQNFDIQTTQPIDENFFRNKLLPRVREEFKRASLDGSFVISGKGIRET